MLVQIIDKIVFITIYVQKKKNYVKQIHILF